MPPRRFHFPPDPRSRPAPVVYTNCPKCGHAPLPKDQAAPAACPACGIILAKFGAPPPRGAAGLGGPRGAAGLGGPRGAAPGGTAGARAEEQIDEHEEPGRLAQLLAAAFYVPNQVATVYWYGRVAAFALLLVWTLFIFKSIDLPDGNSGSNFLHIVLTPFHEAGHVVLRWANSFTVYLGGTLGQHAMPIVLAGALLIKRRDPFGAALFAWLLGYSFVDMGVYMYDAYDPHMMLLTGYTGAESANHDWIQVFGDLNLLNKARGIGQAAAMLGRIMMLAFLAWAAYLLWMQRAHLSDNPSAEDEP